MSGSQNIPGLPAAVGNLNGTEELWAVQQGTDVRVTSQQIANLGVAGDGTVTGPATSVVGHLATWANTTGTVLADGGAPYPGPVPNFATWLQAQFDAGTYANWVWGNVLLNAPAVVTMNGNRTGWGLNLNGAVVSASALYPVNTAVDMVTFNVPNTGAFFIQGFSLLNGIFIATNPTGTQVALNAVTLSCPLNQSAIFGGSVINVKCYQGTRSGLQAFGSIFETDFISCMASGNTFAGLEFRNPTQGGGAGVISSIKVIGGDFRENFYGIAMTSVTNGQAAHGIHIYGADFIVNNSAGIRADNGLQLVDGCHFENNCVSNGGETTASIWMLTGGGFLRNCDNAYNFAAGVYLVDINSGAGPGAFGVLTDGCSSLNENTGTQHNVGILQNTGSLWIENFDDPSHYDVSGSWTINQAADLDSPVFTGTITTSGIAAPAANNLTLLGATGAAVVLGVNGASQFLDITSTAVSPSVDLSMNLGGSGNYFNASFANVNLMKPGSAPSPPASGWALYVDGGDSNKLKAIASTGTVVVLGTP